MSSSRGSSSGHKLGQLVGDWFEKHVALALLQSVAQELGLYLDHRFQDRSCRSGKIKWADLDGNEVDYDFVLELGGTDNNQGVPVAFFETFWRRGSRHSKDKARDDSGKLLPMRETYPTARVLGIIAAGDFTKPAQDLIGSRNIDLFWLPKAMICAAWEACGVAMDYDDGAAELVKREIVNRVEPLLTDRKQQDIYKRLISIVGQPVFTSYTQRIIASVAAVPIEFRLTCVFVSQPIVFLHHQDADIFLRKQNLSNFPNGSKLFRYEVVFSDGHIFYRANLNPDEAIKLHEAVGSIAENFRKYHERQTAT